jgi:squalene synthase HpnC
METPREVSPPTESETVACPGPGSGPKGFAKSGLGPPAARQGIGQILEDLKRFGPGINLPPMAVDEAFAYCRNLSLKHYENFSVTNLWMPRHLHPHFCSIYAYCRWSDDLADEMGSRTTATHMLAWWQSELDRCYQGRASHPVFIALRHTISQFALPKQPFDDLLSAFVQDQSVTRYATDRQLMDYCRRSADPVGRLVLHLANTVSPETVRLSDAICSGLQLANFCQDIAVDAGRDRIYWPLARLHSASITESDLLQGLHGPHWNEALHAWVDSARELLISGAPLVQFGPRWFARSIQLFLRGGLTILDNIAAQSFDVWHHSITVSQTQKLRCMLDACLRPRGLRWLPPPSRSALLATSTKAIDRPQA